MLNFVDDFLKRNPEINLRCFSEKEYRSERYDQGGESWDYNGNHWPRGVDEIKEFNFLDALLEEIWPEIPLIKYKKIKSECVELVYETVDDYYSDGTVAYWRFYVDRFINMMLGFGIKLPGIEE